MPAFSRLFVFGLVLVGIGVLLLSWLPNPDVGNVLPVPAAIRQWVNANGNLRTAVPFVLLGMLGEGLLPPHRSNLMARLKMGGVFLLLVVIAELGQLWLPKRHFDWGDIGYGALGTAVGMGIGFCFKHWFYRSQRHI